MFRTLKLYICYSISCVQKYNSMKKIYVISLFFIMATSIFNSALSSTPFYDLSAIDINGDSFSFEQLKGKKVMIVNTASKCGYTPQYAELQELYEQFKDKDFVIIAFPANNFMRQEPGTNLEILEFCSVNFGVTFPMMEKISVKGKDMHAVYQWLTLKENNGVKDSSVKWNFQKYLIDEKGNLVDVLPSRTSPLSDEVIEWINK